jgi:hypothetical protein
MKLSVPVENDSCEYRTPERLRYAVWRMGSHPSARRAGTSRLRHAPYASPSTVSARLRPVTFSR